MIAAAVSAAVGGSAAVAAVMAVLMPTVPWFLVGYEVVTVFACVFGVLIGFGRCAAGPALGLACVCGTIALGSVLGDLSAQASNPIAGPTLAIIDLGNVMQMPLTMFMLLRLLAAGVLGGCAAWVVLRRHKAASLPSLGIGLTLGAMALALLAAGYKFRASMTPLGAFGKAMVMIALGVVALALLAAAVHYTVRAFSAGRLGRLQADTPRA